MLKKLGDLCDTKPLLDIFDYSLLTRKDTITAILNLEKKSCKDIYKSLGRKFDVATKSDIPFLALPIELEQSKPSSYFIPVSETTSLE